MTAWQIALNQLNTKNSAGNVCERCGTKFAVSKKQSTKRFCADRCRKEAMAERRKNERAAATT